MTRSRGALWRGPRSDASNRPTSCHHPGPSCRCADPSLTHPYLPGKRSRRSLEDSVQRARSLIEIRRRREVPHRFRHRQPPLRTRPGRRRLQPARRPTGDVSRRSFPAVLGALESGPLGLPCRYVYLAAGHPAVEDLRRGITDGAVRTAAAGKQPHDQPYDQPEQEEPEDAHTKPSERTHSVSVRTHHRELLLYLPGCSGTSPALPTDVAVLVRN